MRPESHTAGAGHAVGSPAVLSLRDVEVRAEGRPLLSGVNLELASRRIAIVGANGSGKSTFARLLNGTRLADAGTVRVLGLDPAQDSRTLRGKVGFLFTDPAAQVLMPTPAEDIALSLRDLPRPLRAERTAQLLDEFGLAAHADAPVTTLSGGQRQLLAIAAVLATNPDLVVADEPTTLLDLGNARRIADLLLGLDAHVVIVTHDLELAARCDEAVLFDSGRVVTTEDAGQVVDRYRRMHA